MPERLAVLGDPIAHSLSPAMQCAALRAAGIDGVYEAHHVTADDLASHVERLRAEGYRGWNVTVPHKQAMATLVDETAPSARRIGAVNTAVREDDRLIGHSTDGEGFNAALDAVIAVAGWKPRRAILFGAGGSARAVAQVLVERGMMLDIVNRTPERAASIAGSLGPRARVVRPELVVEEVAEVDLIVNSTSLGMPPQQDRSPLPEGARLAPQTIVMDLVYGRETPLLRGARLAGCVTQDGLEMLVRQGAASFRLWFGVDPDVDAMREACLDALMEVR